MSKTVYVVTSGEYSDYHLVALFGTRKRAEAYVREFLADRDGDRSYGYGERPRIEEWPVDAPQDQWWTTRVVMDRGGQVLQIHTVFSYSVGLTRHHLNRVSPRLPGHYLRSLGLKDGQAALETEAATKNEKRAIKIANDHRRQLIAENQWKEPSDASTSE